MDWKYQIVCLEKKVHLSLHICFHCFICLFVSVDEFYELVDNALFFIEYLVEFCAI